MMRKTRSVLKSGIFSLFVMPILSIFLFLVCSDLKTDREFYPMKWTIMDGVKYKADPVLYMKGGYVESKTMTSYFKRSDDKSFTKKGDVFSGTQIYINSSNKERAWKDTYEKGLHIHRVYLEQDLIEKNNASEIVIKYRDGELRENFLYDKNGAISSRVEIGDSVTRLYGHGNQLFTSYSTITPETGLGYFKEWHPNGQLKFEMYSDSLNRNQGYMILYDENGEILQQELYENGELIEKIK